MTITIKDARALAAELATGTGLTEKRANEDGTGGVIRDAWVHDRMQRAAEALAALCEQIEVGLPAKVAKHVRADKAEVLDQEQRRTLTLRVIEIFQDGPREGYAYDSFAPGLRHPYRYEPLLQNLDGRLLLRRMEDEGFLQNERGLWSLTAGGALWAYLENFAAARSDVPREKVEVQLDAARPAKVFDRFAAKEVNKAAHELRGRNLVEFNSRTRVLTLSDWCLPLAHYAGVKEG